MRNLPWRPPCQAALLACSFAAIGCQDSFEQRVAALATPTGALASDDPELPGLIAAVQQQQGLPLQIAAAGGLDDRNNAAEALAAAYSPSLHLQLTDLTKEMVSPLIDLSARRKFLELHELLVTKTAVAVDLPRCRFDAGHEYGFFGAMSYLDNASLANRLLRVRCLAAGLVGEGEVIDGPAAMADLLRALRVCHCLSAVERVEGRVLAASLRAETFDAAAVLIEEGALRRHEAELLYGALRDQLTDWPSDSGMLVGERATVIHAYEAIRAGMLDRLITLDERRRLNSGGRLDTLREATPDEVDADEARYLKASQRLISIADQPYHQRLGAIDEALEVIEAAPTSFAATLFTQDLPTAIRRVALDRATVEAWTIALASLAELRLPPFRDNALTGQAYVVERVDDRLVVAIDDGIAVDLPLLPR